MDSLIDLMEFVTGAHLLRVRGLINGGEYLVTSALYNRITDSLSVEVKKEGKTFRSIYNGKDLETINFTYDLRKASALFNKEGRQVMLEFSRTFRDTQMFEYRGMSDLRLGVNDLERSLHILDLDRGKKSLTNTITDLKDELINILGEGVVNFDWYLYHSDGMVSRYDIATDAFKFVHLDSGFLFEEFVSEMWERKH